jgi:hypothetical protein
MGCDIHCFTEVRINGAWHLWDQPDPGRHYSMFALMAGVRNYGNEIKPIAEPRGLPADVSAATAFAYSEWEADAHSMSWLSIEEVAEVEKAVRAENQTLSAPFGWLCGNGWDRSELPKGLESARLVFWFDN